MICLYCLLFLLLILVLKCSEKTEHFRNASGLTYYIQGNRSPNSTLRQIFKEFDIKKSEDSVIYIPKSYFGEHDNQFKDLKLKENQIVLFIPGVYHIDEKQLLWNNMVSKYGVEEASKYIPRSYDLNNKNDVNDFLMSSNNETYIGKTEIEDAKGLLVSKNKRGLYEQVKNNETYSIIQKCIMNQYLINDRSFKLRMFVLITCKNGIVNFYLHKQGFVYYAKETFNKENPTFNNIIANAWWFKDMKKKDINDFVSDKPLTLEDFKDYIEARNFRYYNLLVKIKLLLTKIFDATHFHLCKIKKYDANMTICMTGIDILIDENMNPWFIELNKKPGMGSHHIDKIKEIKKTIWLDALDIAFDTRGGDNNFETIKTY